VLRPGAADRLVGAGLGAVMRASRGGVPLASLLLLDGARRACLLEARAAPGDAGLDAAALLALRAAEEAAARGAVELSLGGVGEAEPEAALRFRQAFAGLERHAVHLVTVAGPRAAERLHRAWALCAGSPAALPGALARRLAWIQRFTVHAWGPPEWRPAEPPTGVVLRRLPDDELIALSRRSDAIGTHRLYLQRHGINGAWGLFVDGELAHVTWIYTRAMHDREPFAGLRLADDEAELGNCVTLPRFKGRGLYPLAIRLLSRRLFDEGVRRVLMVTARGNAASERGIEKAGLARVGRLSYLWLPALRRLRIARRVPDMAPSVEWVDLRRAYRTAAAAGPAQGG
jgi:RimJ/RimL family protein N-acetyltransferase